MMQAEFVLLMLSPLLTLADLNVGVGIADATGPIVEVPFMGYGQLKQKGTGLHLRQFSRAFIFDDGVSSFVIVSVDCGMIGDGVRLQVVKMLRKRYGALYTEDNVLISGSHSHSTPGGHLFHMLYDITILGFSKETFNAMVSGIVKSIIKAHENKQPAKLFITKGELLDANINRSPTAYQNNPDSERKNYKFNVDKDMTQLKILTASGKPMGVINWFAVHPTSMNNTNTLVSSDNVGLASILFEQNMNPSALIGKGPFVAAFASTNLGDVSPNTRGPRCLRSGEFCDDTTSTCKQHNNHKDDCIAFGPGDDMFESTRIIGEKLFNKAKELWVSEGFPVSGSIFAKHQYVDMPTAAFEGESNLKVKGCLPAMGYSFGAGTIDGPGASPFSQSTTSQNNPLWNAFRDFLVTPDQEDMACHAPKPILIPTGRMTFPFEWQPRVVSTGLALIGEVAFVCVPAEFTTMAGRRLRQAVKKITNSREIIIVGLCNTYSSYVTTIEEYQAQRYEGASTIFGPNTLEIYLEQYKNLANAINQNTTLNPGPRPTNLMPEVVSLIPPVIFDTAKWSYDFGNVTKQPKSSATVGETVSARFVSGHPRNNLRHGDTFLAVEKRESEEIWSVVATDANWETKFHWIRMSDVLGTSEAVIEWTIPSETPPGEYRIRHYGMYKSVLGGKYPYEGTTKSFHVS